MDIRTDLALEMLPEDMPEGIAIQKRGSVFEITEIDISDDAFAENIGKAKGKYITLECGELSDFSDCCEEMAYELAEEIRRLVPEGDILVAGLGNSDITPDAIGPQTVSKVLATRHLKDELRQENFLTSLRRVSAFAGGVLGQTGIETAEMIRAIASQIKPSAVIVTDALACSDISRLGKTIQLTDTGISPGSGVANARRELSDDILGIPVIAIGVPTVVDMRTIVRNITGQDTGKNFSDMIVTPRNIDRLTERASQLLAFGINLGLHKELTFEDVRSLY